jgi:hypothetical protein
VVAALTVQAAVQWRERTSSVAALQDPPTAAVRGCYALKRSAGQLSAGIAAAVIAADIAADIAGAAGVAAAPLRAGSTGVAPWSGYTDSSAQGCTLA